MNKKLLLPIAFFVLFLLPAVLALEFDDDIDSDDQETFNEILTPLMKIYNFIKYGASGVAVVMLLFSGVNYMTSGSDIKKRENAKHMVTYVVIGLSIIWAAPFIVNLLVG